ncbi:MULTISPECIES: Trm112 family protein [unclassified Devosia]|uniref:Trm112 family protein n=1 Tax=unclassified Devosia TaxID=196773 RepID=UPI00145D4FEF|nr:MULTISPECIES: Trm112 family protein [unclassified Devosia]MBJ6987153.1 Trm112 family protein [Devosia sp. MC521]MBJ7577349.1 Trm112 family protein [Devosia sp. MC532]MBK1795168.1 Trm112 family protein [Devosia sp. WQ 349K1]QMW62768.1 Trm112 family protein [Devosia sp. MC521]
MVKGDIVPRYVLHPQTLEMLVCPMTKTRLTLSPDKSELISVAARLAFPIVKGVPLLSLDDARAVELEEIQKLRLV